MPISEQQYRDLEAIRHQTQLNYNKLEVRYMRLKELYEEQQSIIDAYSRHYQSQVLQLPKAQPSPFL